MGSLALLDLDEFGQLRITFGPGENFSSEAHGTSLEFYLDAHKTENSRVYLLGQADRISTLFAFLSKWTSEEGFRLDIGASLRPLIDSIQVERTSIEKIKAERAGPSINLDHVLPRRKLLNHQVIAVQRAVSLGNAADFSVPGSGKTTTALCAFSLARAHGDVQKLLVVGPISSFAPWEDEIESCLGTSLRVKRLVGTQRDRDILLHNLDDVDVILCTYQMATREVDNLRDVLLRHPCMFVLDEAHNIKRYAEGVWAEAMLQLAPFARKRMILTGTPAPRSVFDLWTQFTFLWPSGAAVGSRAAFERTLMLDGPQAVGDSVRPLFHRTRKADLGLPPPTFSIVPIEQADWPPLQRRAIRLLEVRTLKDLQTLNLRDRDLRALLQWRKARMVRLLMAASNPALLAGHEPNVDDLALDEIDEIPELQDLVRNYNQVERSAKVSWVTSKARELVEAGQKVVIWTSFVGNIKLLEVLLADHDPLLVYGELRPFEEEDDSPSEISRERNIRRFKSSKDRPILIANPAACAESISLHKVCQAAIYLDRTFNCGQFMQSLDRIHRVGLPPDAKVSYYIPVMNCAVDRLVDHRLTARQRFLYTLMLDEALPIGGWSDDLLIDDDEELATVLVDLQHELEAEMHGRE